jgi:hypothetical protein
LCCSPTSHQGAADRNLPGDDGSRRGVGFPDVG